jgi:hypothetical protein
MNFYSRRKRIGDNLVKALWHSKFNLGNGSFAATTWACYTHLSHLLQHSLKNIGRVSEMMITEILQINGSQYL